MAERHRLRALEMRVAGHQRLRVLFRAVEQHARESLDPRRCLGARVQRPQPERRDDLVVPRPARVDLPPDLAEQALDRGVHVLVGLLDHRRVERGEPRLDLRELLRLEDPGDGEPPRVQPRALDVVREQLGVGRLDELPDLGSELGVDAPGPERHTGTLRARAAASSASSEASRMNPSAASCGNVSPVA